MINVETLYQNGVRTLLSKGKGGYVSSAEFNAISKRAELTLWQYYFEQFEENRRVPEAMYPFLVEADQPLDSQGRFDLPANYGHFTRVRYGYVQNGADCGDEPIVTGSLAQYLEKTEEDLVLTSPILKPSQVKGLFYYAFAPGNKVQLYPVNLVGVARVEYLRYPTYAVRGFTVDATNDEEAYSANASTNYEWPAQEEMNLLDLILLEMGIRIRDSQIINWASSRNLIVPNVAS